MLVASTILFLQGSAAALDYMGPPVAVLKRGQFRTGFDLAMGEMDVEFEGEGAKDTLNDFEYRRYLWCLGYGLRDNWEGFVRLGAGDAETEGGFDGDTRFAYGLGTKVTLAGDNMLNWGALLQVGWGKSENSYDDLLGLSGDGEIDWYEIQAAAGGTYDMEDWRLYGGLFLHYVGGDLDVEDPFFGAFSFDLEQESVPGGYVGARFDLRKNVTLDTEFQVTSDAWALGLGLAYKF